MEGLVCGALPFQVIPWQVVSGMRMCRMHKRGPGGTALWCMQETGLLFSNMSKGVSAPLSYRVISLAYGLLMDHPRPVIGRYTSFIVPERRSKIVVESSCIVYGLIKNFLGFVMVIIHILFHTPTIVL